MAVVRVRSIKQDTGFKEANEREKKKKKKNLQQL